MREVRANSGAKFVRADLHIHTFGEKGSFDVTDTSMTPMAIVDEAVSKNILMISITDHNEILNSQEALAYARGKSVVIIPGIEVSTTQGHLLAYFKSFEDLRSFYGKLTFSEDRQRCYQGTKECLDLIETQAGIGVLAHIELDAGFESTIGRFSGPIEDIICHPMVHALEISSKANLVRYTEDDNSPDRKRLALLRGERLPLPPGTFLPKVMFSDSHSLAKFGKNAAGESKLTRFKVDSVTFDSLRIALLNHESRVRIEDTIPERFPRFISMSIDGGILNEQDVAFSPNLTCIIGGRGTGKSTLLESLRVSSGNESKSSVVDSEVWPDEIALLYEDETGGQTRFVRQKEMETRNDSDPAFGLEKVKIESYGQGETAATIQNSDKDPVHLLNFLDGFIEVQPSKAEDNEVCDLLAKNRSDLQKTRIELSSEAEFAKVLRDLEGRKKRLESEKVGELVTFQTALVAEKSLRQEVVEKLKKLIEQYRVALGDTSHFKYFSELDASKIIVGKTEFSAVKKIISEFAEIVMAKSGEISAQLGLKIAELKTQVDSWTNRETEINKKISDKKTELLAAGVPIDNAMINKLATDLDFYRAKMIRFQALHEHLKQLEAVRKELLEKRVTIKNAQYALRLGFANRVNKNLLNSVDGFFVKATFTKGCFSPLFEDSLKLAMDWRTSQVPRAGLISGSISPLEFAEVIRKRDKPRLVAIPDAEGRRLLSDGEIQAIFNRLSGDYAYEEFSTIPFDDRPNLKVTKIIVHDDGRKEHVTRSIAQLSLGQQQSVLLAILIQSDSAYPLLIDQPEDNLDSEFIYKTIVKNLRQIKERRQVIVVTHNANIAVLGDAELVVPLKSTSSRSVIRSAGSIDTSEVRDLCCDILEGGRAAFISRKRIYGI